ncbi:glutamyl-tRNA synthetase [Azospirillum fermentarium]|uniref:glutamate--tRNA ligase n=1 Tax=Azospirillum fermentarium TaxID=1233114 RepID=UPI002225C691|nr:glutamate--tRNA ligase [Azospirillum fermentarium]MCW2248772.1 glutamyl-tRNA synthetase [Azospirillum fermentarium]
MTVVTRFAPSPTGFLHIGGARTALFNWLYARHHGGTFLLRIEDTDRARSTQAAVDAILDGLSWLGLMGDNEPVSQFDRKDRHAEVARQLLAEGKAYHCYASPEELDAMRAAQKAAGQPVRYDGRWRDRPASDAPEGVKPVIRLKAPQTGETVLKDEVQGTVTVQNSQLDDLILLRADGTPTYLLAVVVDDHDMGVTHVIRGDDHLTNTFRQIQIFNAMGWDLPSFSHIPLIHGPDGAKLSKRHGALGVDAYRDMGYLPEAIRNYLLRLGWGHGDDEIISTEQAIAWFGLEGIGRSPSRFDFAKLENLNAHYMRQADDGRLVALIAPRLESARGSALTEAETALLTRAMPGLKARARTVVDLAASAAFYIAPRPLALDDKARGQLNADARALLGELAALFAAESVWTAAALEARVRAFAEAKGEKLGKVAQPLRAALSGSTVSPPIFEVAELLGRDETLGRMGDASNAAPQ